MLNKAMIIGNLGADPEVRATPNGMSMAKFSVATSEKWKDKKTGEMNEKTEWHRVTVFVPSAESCGQYLSKGSKVYVEGKIETSEYEKDGETRYSTGIIGQRVQFLDSRSKDTQPSKQESIDKDFDDDIPF